jgi:hypothetical protein
MGLEKLDFQNEIQYLSKNFGHILKANDIKHHISQIQPYLTILMAPKREMKTKLFLPSILPFKHPMFSFIV